MKIERIPVNVALRLFDACVLPILTYGVEIWAEFERFDFDSSEKCPIEEVDLRFCKHLLGVNRSTMNLLCLVELGRRPIQLITDFKVINFYKQYKSLPTDDLSYIAFDEDRIIFNENNTIDHSFQIFYLQTIFVGNFISKGNINKSLFFIHIMIRFVNEN